MQQISLHEPVFLSGVHRNAAVSNRICFQYFWQCSFCPQEESTWRVNVVWKALAGEGFGIRRILSTHKCPHPEGRTCEIHASRLFLANWDKILRQTVEGRELKEEPEPWRKHSKDKLSQDLRTLHGIIAKQKYLSFLPSWDRSSVAFKRSGHQELTLQSAHGGISWAIEDRFWKK